METVIVSLGGSLIAPSSVDSDFLKAFRSLVLGWLEPGQRRIVLITGGGAPARVYQEAYRAVFPHPEDNQADWIGIAATHLNGALVRAVFAEDCLDPLVTDPTADFGFHGKVLVAAGWKPGFSTDFDAVMLAQKLGAKRVINLSNIAQVYTDDPKKNPQAKPLVRINWKDFQQIVGTEWVPGKNVPFDPIATKKAAELGLEVVVAGGKNLTNLEDLLWHREFFGTTIVG